MAAEDRIDGYASAILEVAKAEGELDRIGDEMFRIARAFASSNELREALTDARLPVERKQAMIDDLLGADALLLTVSLVGFVVAAGRGADLPAIADRLAERAAGERGKVIAEVRTAAEIDDETVERLATALSGATGRDVEVKTVVDPSVVGGIVARIGDTVIDGTLRHRFEELRETLTRR